MFSGFVVFFHCKIMDAYFKQVRQDIKARRKLCIASGESGNAGVHTIEAYHTDFIGPIAVVWYMFSGRDRLEILNSYVDERLRRCGLRTHLHEAFIKFYPERVIVSNTGTKTGLAWMKATGYKLVQNGAGWEYRKHLK